MTTALRGPAFGSYRAEDVGWLLTDLSAVPLEAPADERERAIQAGAAHYAESLPIEYRPSGEYLALFHRAIRTHAARLAHDVGVLAELVRHVATPHPVLLSLARAGTPIGVLVRRWLRRMHGLDVPHYAISIVRGRGIDVPALRWVAARHDVDDVVFIDGWTGKGAIARELAAALAGLRDGGPAIPHRLAVLADPAGCTDLFGTRDDYLIPSACLNATVSGLVSRTVLGPGLTRPGEFHGAKYYRELAGSDLSRVFLDRVAARFAAVADAVAEDWVALAAADRAPTWSGWAAVRAIGVAYGVADPNLIKPGIGETTRVLLRRIPWRVLIREGAGADVDHIRLLAAQRGVPVDLLPDLPYQCVGLIRPVG